MSSLFGVSLENSAESAIENTPNTYSACLPKHLKCMFEKIPYLAFIVRDVNLLVLLLSPSSILE